MPTPAVDALRPSTDTLTDSSPTQVRMRRGDLDATLTITIHGTNDAPVADADVGPRRPRRRVNAAGSNATGNVLPTTPTSIPATRKTVTAVTAAPSGPPAAAYGTLTLNADGSYTYVVDNADPAVDALRLSTDTLTDTFSYPVQDAAGATAAPA